VKFSQWESIRHGCLSIYNFFDGINWFSGNFSLDSSVISESVMSYFSRNVYAHVGSIFMVVVEITELLHKIHVFINKEILVMSEIHAYTK
jgi:hypothetical protein